MEAIAVAFGITAGAGARTFARHWVPVGVIPAVGCDHDWSGSCTYTWLADLHKKDTVARIRGTVRVRAPFRSVAVVSSLDHGVQIAAAAKVQGKVLGTWPAGTVPLVDRKTLHGICRERACQALLQVPSLAGALGLG